jgi:DNA-binding PadR family transcriptional regulator
MPPKLRCLSPLALAVLALLYERPMHPYEMASTLRERGKEKSIKLRYGSLYTVIGALQRDGLIAPRGKERTGGRPERTVFDLTPPGSEALTRSLSDMLARPAKEYPQFMAGLSLMPILPPEAVLRLLHERLTHLSAQIDALRTEMADAERGGLAALFLVEHDYELVMAEAECRYVRRLVERIAGDDLGGMSFWRRWHGEHGGPERPAPSPEKRKVSDD